MEIIKNEPYKIVKIKTGPLSTNCYIIYNKNKNAAIIDFAFCNEKIEQIFSSENLKLKFILLTHGHFDHIMGLENGLNILKQNCPVFINASDLELLADSYKNASKFMDFNVELNLNNIQTFKENAIFKLENNIKFKAIATPGHTSGSSSFIINDELMFTGDALFKNSSGRTDLFSGSEKESKQTLKKFSTLNPNLKILPGHGSQTTLGQEIKNSPIFKAKTL